jgi:phosphosulfolactate synthase
MPHTVDQIFPVPRFVKPRPLRQTWLKDVGWHEAPGYREHLGLAELADFLEVAGARLDYVKLLPAQIINAPRAWLERKIATYHGNVVATYLDHTYFLTAYRHGTVEPAIALAGELGVRAIEFMNTGADVTPGCWQRWRAQAAEHGLQVIFEYHPPHHWDPAEPVRASGADEILQAATPFLDGGAVKLMIDHDEFDLMGDHAEEELSPLVARLGLATLVFEVASPKDGAEKWHRHLTDYFRRFGPDCNVANLMPSQVMAVEPLREAQRGDA